MPLVTRFKDPAGLYVIEEDSQGRLWLGLLCRGAGGLNELHRLLTPGERRDFERKGTVVRARAKFMLHHPAGHFDAAEEEDYRRQ